MRNQIVVEGPMRNQIVAEGPIGYFTVLIDKEKQSIIDIACMMRAHKVYVQKSNEDPADDWWFFLLPRGSTRQLQKCRSSIPRYTVCLPDGYSFTLEQGPLNRDGYFTTPPLIFLDRV